LNEKSLETIVTGGKYTLWMYKRLEERNFSLVYITIFRNGHRTPEGQEAGFTQNYNIRSSSCSGMLPLCLHLMSEVQEAGKGVGPVW